MSFVPKKVFFVKGIGYHKSKLGAFEQALRNAGIEKFNLVNVSSILPPHCVEISKKDGLERLLPGQILYIVMSRAESKELECVVCASIGVAMPADKDQYGYLSEHHTHGEKPVKTGDYAEDLAVEMLATTLGFPFDPNANYDEKREVFEMRGKIVKTKNITEFASVRNKGEWASVLAAAVFII